ncbi:hypothetical protein ONZ45_g19342 [Pleurotus djamor]|nr:hypothetical protein ONZ45_g19342 [Pleurotus djamor]
MAYLLPRCSPILIIRLVKSPLQPTQTTPFNPLPSVLCRLVERCHIRYAEILEKYQLKANDAILAEERHLPLYDEIVKNHQVTYVAGGAAQNAARAAAYILPPKSVLFLGCVGNDELAHRLEAANTREGLDYAYQYREDDGTGACAVVITGHNRSLVSTLRAARKFNITHFNEPHVFASLNAAKVFYVEGYFLTHGLDCVLDLGSRATMRSTDTFVLNLAAPYLLHSYNNEVKQVLPYCDIVIGNEAEAFAYGASNNVPQDLHKIAQSISMLPKANPAKPRVVIFTQGAEATIYVTSYPTTGVPGDVKVVPVKPLEDGEIGDTNGAGDAFAGGFLAGWILGKNMQECVEIGHKMGGPQFKWPKVQVVET